MSTRIGVDTGGTFTDLVALDEESGELHLAKQPSTPDNPSRAVFNVLSRSGINLADTSLLVLGTTIGTNALLERKGARVVYITTVGFEDIPFIQRIDKKDPYDLQWQKPEPFVTRRDCIGVRERVLSDGSILESPSLQELERLKSLVYERLGNYTDDTAIAVNLLFSYLNPENEKLLKDFLTRHFPTIPVSISSEISPIWREYERASTTIIDAYLKPRMSAFVEGLEHQLSKDNFRGTLAEEVAPYVALIGPRAWESVPV